METMWIQISRSRLNVIQWLLTCVSFNTSRQGRCFTVKINYSVVVLRLYRWSAVWIDVQAANRRSIPSEALRAEGSGECRLVFARLICAFLSSSSLVMHPFLCQCLCVSRLIHSDVWHDMVYLWQQYVVLMLMKDRSNALTGVAACCIVGIEAP